MDKFDAGFMTYKDLEGTKNKQVIANALVLINNNLCGLVNELETLNELCRTGINVNNRVI